MRPVAIDINECHERIICSDFCVNTMGSYRCECRKGYELARDGKTCRGICMCEMCGMSNIQIM